MPSCLKSLLIICTLQPAEAIRKHESDRPKQPSPWEKQAKHDKMENLLGQKFHINSLQNNLYRAENHHEGAEKELQKERRIGRANWRQDQRENHWMNPDSVLRRPVQGNEIAPMRKEKETAEDLKKAKSALERGKDRVRRAMGNWERRGTFSSLPKGPLSGR